MDKDTKSVMWRRELQHPLIHASIYNPRMLPSLMVCPGMLTTLLTSQPPPAKTYSITIPTPATLSPECSKDSSQKREHCHNDNNKTFLSTASLSYAEAMVMAVQHHFLLNNDSSVNNHNNSRNNNHGCCGLFAIVHLLSALYTELLKKQKIFFFVNWHTNRRCRRLGRFQFGSDYKNDDSCIKSKDGINSNARPILTFVLDILIYSQRLYEDKFEKYWEKKKEEKEGVVEEVGYNEVGCGKRENTQKRRKRCREESSISKGTCKSNPEEAYSSGDAEEYQVNSKRKLPPSHGCTTTRSQHTDDFLDDCDSNEIRTEDCNGINLDENNETGVAREWLSSIAFMMAYEVLMETIERNGISKALSSPFVDNSSDFPSNDDWHLDPITKLALCIIKFTRTLSLSVRFCFKKQLHDLDRTFANTSNSSSSSNNNNYSKPSCSSTRNYDSKSKSPSDVSPSSKDGVYSGHDDHLLCLASVVEDKSKIPTIEEWIGKEDTDFVAADDELNTGPVGENIWKTVINSKVDIVDDQEVKKGNGTKDQSFFERDTDAAQESVDNNLSSTLVPNFRIVGEGVRTDSCKLSSLNTQRPRNENDNQSIGVSAFHLSKRLHEATIELRSFLLAQPRQVITAEIQSSTDRVLLLLAESGEELGTEGVEKVGNLLCYGDIDTGDEALRAKGNEVDNERPADQKKWLTLDDAILASIAVSFVNEGTSVLRVSAFIRSFVFPVCLANLEEERIAATREMTSFISLLASSRPTECVKELLIPLLRGHRGKPSSKVQCELVMKVVKTSMPSEGLDRYLFLLSTTFDIIWTEQIIVMVSLCLSKTPSLSNECVTAICASIERIASLREMATNVKFSIMINTMIAKYGQQIKLASQVNTLQEAVAGLKSFMVKPMAAALKKLK